MPIDSTHPKYKEAFSFWEKMRDAYNGEDAVKAKKTKYLPRLSSHKSGDDAEYLSYLKRAMFYGATARTVDGLQGMIMRKQPVFNLPKNIEHLITDATGTGIDLVSLISIAAKELILTGRVELHVDRPIGGGDTYLVFNSAESVINWRSGPNGKLDLLVIMETYYDNQDDYALVEKIRIREFFIDDGQAKSRVWEKSGDRWIPGESVTMTKLGNPIDYIPASFANINGLSDEIEEPPLLQMVNVNYSHYMTMADLEHGRHFTALPTPWISGVDKSDFGDGVYIGSTKCILIEDSSGSAGYMEFTGNGLKALMDAAEQKEKMMAVLGARMLESQKRAAESADTARIVRSGDTSILSSIAESLEQLFRKVLSYALDWEGGSGDFEFSINKDFIDATVSNQMITSLMQAWQNGAISHETFLYNMKKGEILQDDIDVEDELVRIANQKPVANFDDADKIDVGDGE